MELCFDFGDILHCLGKGYRGCVAEFLIGGAMRVRIDSGCPEVCDDVVHIARFREVLLRFAFAREVLRERADAFFIFGHGPSLLCSFVCSGCPLP